MDRMGVKSVGVRIDASALDALKDFICLLRNERIRIESLIVRIEMILERKEIR